MATAHLRRYSDEVSRVIQLACDNYATNYQAAARLLARTYRASAPVFVFGNGGSAAVANHFVCDHVKGITKRLMVLSRPFSQKVKSLCSDIELITAIANDISYDKIFSEQLYYDRGIPELGVAIAMSVSGSSRNIIEGLLSAREIGHETIALVGKDGGVVKQDGLSDYVIHFESDNYGVVEDCFSIVMHSLAQCYVEEGV